MARPPQRCSDFVKKFAIILAIVLAMGCASQVAAPITDDSSGDVPIPTHDTIEQSTTSSMKETTTTESLKVTQTIAGHAFQSPSITVTKGTIVTWRNSDSMNHPLKSSLFASPDMGKDSEFSYTFSAVGTYEVEITTHPAQKMTVKVE